MLLKVSQLTILLQCHDERGVLRFPIDHQAYFGLTKPIDPTQAISKQLACFAAAALARPDLEAQIEPLITIEPILQIPSHDPSLLYLMKIGRQHFVADSHWPTLIEALKAMPQGRMRVAYNKALQYFAGAASQKIDILEVDQEVAERLKKLVTQKPLTLLE